MPRAEILYPRSRVSRAIKAVEDAGKLAKAVEFNPSGSFTVIIGEPGAPDATAIGNGNPWDQAIRDATNEERAP